MSDPGREAPTDMVTPEPHTAQWREEAKPEVRADKCARPATEAGDQSVADSD